MPFSDYLIKLLPTSWRRAIGAKYLTTLGQALDGSADGDYVGRGTGARDWGLITRAKLAVKARFPDYADDEALATIGDERGIERGKTESTTNYATRLRQAWETWQFGGTAYGLLLQLWALGYQNVHIVIVNGKTYTLQSNTGDPATDLVKGTLGPQSWWPSPGACSTAQPARRWWTRWGLIFDAPLPSPATGAPSDWNTAVPDTNSDEANTVRRIIQRWQPAYAICDGIIVKDSHNSTGLIWGWPVGGVNVWGNAAMTWGAAPAAARWSP